MVIVHPYSKIKPKKPKLSTDEEEIQSIEDKVEIARLEKMPTMQK